MAWAVTRLYSPCLAKNAFGHRCMVSFSRNHLPPFTPCLRAGNMGTVQTDGLTHCPAAADLFDVLSPSGIPGGQWLRSAHAPDPTG